MIGDWLRKHKWINELGKTLDATFFFILVGGGILGMLTLFILLFLLMDVVYSIIGIKRKRYSQ